LVASLGFTTVVFYLPWYMTLQITSTFTSKSDNKGHNQLSIRMTLLIGVRNGGMIQQIG